jgi:hypothetical protein
LTEALGFFEEKGDFIRAFLFGLNLEGKGAVPVAGLHEALRRDREIFQISSGSGGSGSQTLSLTCTLGRQEGMLTYYRAFSACLIPDF